MLLSDGGRVPRSEDTVLALRVISLSSHHHMVVSGDDGWLVYWLPSAPGALDLLSLNPDNNPEKGYL